MGAALRELPRERGGRRFAEQGMVCHGKAVELPEAIARRNLGPARVHFSLAYSPRPRCCCDCRQGDFVRLSRGLAERRILWMARQAVVKRPSIALGREAASAEQKQARQHCKSQGPRSQIRGYFPLPSPFLRLHCGLLCLFVLLSGKSARRLCGSAPQSGRRPLHSSGWRRTRTGGLPLR